MLARLTIALFWAAIFFGLGAWSGGHLRPIGDALVTGGEYAGEKAVRLWTWARHGAPDAAPDTSPATTAAALVDKGRAAFARGDLQGAVDAYREALELRPGDADILGELGNVYYTSGQTAEAALAFHAAAEALIDSGRIEAARALLPAVRAAAPTLAADLDARLAATAPVTQ